MFMNVLLVYFLCCSVCLYKCEPTQEGRFTAEGRQTFGALELKPERWGQGQKGDSEYMGRMILRLKLPGMRLVGVRMQRIGWVGWREMIGHR